MLAGDFAGSAMLLFMLLNPFLMSVYLLDLIQSLDPPTFARVLIRGALISGSVFIFFAWLGDVVFRDVLHVRFGSFLIFGGVVFLIIGVRFVFQGNEALHSLRGSPEHVAGSVALPFMIGPGTVGASVLAGSRLHPLAAAAAVVLALSSTVLAVLVLKSLHDYVKHRNELLVTRYIDITGRIMALVIGTFAIEMILQGVEGWLQELSK